MRYLSLFSGIGGFELGMQQAYGYKISRTKDVAETANRGEEGKETRDKKGQFEQLPKHTPVGLSCIGFSEKDKYATQIYQKHFPNHKAYGDVTKIDEKTLPDFDLLVGGFPCQSFSIAGKRKGFRDTRGTMFFEIARIVREKQPRLLLLENVKGLLSHDKGRTFYTIISTLDELGYDCQWQVLNSKNHGVPQNRERVFIIGHLRGTPRPEVFPFGETNQAHSKSDKNKVARCLDANYAKGWLDNGQRTMLQSGNKQPFIQQRPRGKNKGGRHSVAPTITGQAYKDNNHVNAIRRLTPTECERLQGFPDGWTEYGWYWSEGDDRETLSEIPISDTQRYKTLGNAVTVNVIRDIMVKLL